MTSPSALRRQRDKARVRDRILDAAREIFATEGYEAVTMRRVAEAIEYTPPVIYQHFADKATLIEELCRHDFQQFSRSFNVLANVSDPIDRLRAMGLGYVEFGLAHPHHYRVMFMNPAVLTYGEKEGMGQPDLDAYAFLLQATEAAMQAGRFNPELTDPHLVAQVLWHGVHGIVSLHVAWPDEKWPAVVDPRAKARVTVDAIMHGLTWRAGTSAG